ncbi:CocE/NonD family hydrolase [Pseudonocardia nigra]|uniref:CocE/NonD family hydrolase n=1 Tax=Pseudonocardia nigra TaxID=1921578 RepID=UPI001C5CEC19|nr:CocE/NonD family hydrolase [Pseudonocardia nigra]
MQITAVRPGPVPPDAVEVAIPMRDGVELAADVYAPAPQAQPVVLVRLPYDKDGAYCFMPDIARYITERGYAVVVQDVRGKFRSGGATEFGVHEVDDGYDTVEWVAAQPWCTGAVAMWGDSYFGMTQLAAAASGHPALKAISPRLTGTRLAQEVTYADGSRDVEATARKRYFAGWYVDRNAYEWPMDWTARPLRAPFERFFAELGTRSVNFDAEFPRQSRFAGPSLESLLDAPAVPTLFTVGLFDNCAIYSWHDLRELLAHERWGRSVRLRLEAVDHENGHFDERIHEFSDGRPDLDRILAPALDFFDVVVRDRGDVSALPAVVHETCHGETREAPAWPPPDARAEALFLSGGDGGPELTERAGAPATASWRHDPDRPVPSVAADPFARLTGWRDLSDIATRPDVLHAEGPVCADPIDYAGPVRVEVFLESTVHVANLHARLLDVGPDGTHHLVTKGQVHLPEVPADRPVCVDLLSISYRLRTGHRLALQLMSSDFPDYVLEPGDGSDPWEAEVFRVSEQTVQLGGPRAGRLYLTRR